MSLFEPSLPSHCEPTNEFLLQFSSTFHTCIPTPLAFLSNTLGILSIIAWLFAQLPQIYKNWSISSTSGLSIFFLVEWCLGDLSNLLGALFTHQASWQVTIGSYYVFVDICLVAQWFWYEKLRHGRIVRRVWQKDGGESGPWSGGGMQVVGIEGLPTYSDTGNTSPSATEPLGRQKHGSKAQNIVRKPRLGHTAAVENEKASSLSPALSLTTIHRVGPSSPIPSPSPRTILLIACFVAIVQASPVTKSRLAPNSDVGHQRTTLENVGTILSWVSTVLYLGSRLPQLVKNWRRKSTAGLSPLLFAAAFCGNLLYSLALLTNPCAWSDFEQFGGRGWAGIGGSDRTQWVAAALPFFLGASGVLGLDASVGLQFVLYGDGNSKVVLVEESEGHRFRWHKVSGWMRGWVPSMGTGKSWEGEALLERSDQHGGGYGAL